MSTTPPPTEDVEVEFNDDIEVIEANDAVQLFSQHSSSIYSLASAPEGQFHGLIASGAGDDCAFLWDVFSGTSLAQLSEFNDSVVACEFSTDSTYLAVGSLDGVVKVWSVEALVHSASLPDKQTVPDPVCELNDFGDTLLSLQWHPKGNFLLVGSGPTAFMYAIPQGTCSRVFAGPDGEVTSLLWANNGKLVVTGHENGALALFSPRDASCLARMNPGTVADPRSTGTDLVVTCLTVHDQSKMIAIGDEVGMVSLFKMVDGQLRRLHCQKVHADSVESLHFVQQGSWLLSASTDETLLLFDVKHNSVRFQLNLGAAATGCSVGLFDGIACAYAMLVSGSIAVVDLGKGCLITSIDGHNSPILTHCFGPSNVLVVGADDGNILVFAPGSIPDEEDENEVME
ncbi:hypothetical protein P9112_002540 [Eukaryota sp. TZLM1-RC]